MARVLAVIAGHDPLDSTSMTTARAGLSGGAAGRYPWLEDRLAGGVFRRGLAAGCRGGGKRTAAAQLECMGAEVQELSFRYADYCLPAYYIIAMAEASANLARYDGVRFGARVEGADLIGTYKKTRGAGFGEEVKRRIMLGTYALSAGYYDAYYGKAQAVRTLIRQEFEEMFGQVDVLLAPVAPTTAFKFGEVMDDPLQMILADELTISANLAGICGLSVPCGFDAAGLADWDAVTGRGVYGRACIAAGAGLSGGDRLAFALAGYWS